MRDVCRKRCGPIEACTSVTRCVHTRLDAAPVPESTAMVRCAVTDVRVVVSVISAEHHPIMVVKCISGVTRVPGYLHSVVGRLIVYHERTVLSIVPAAITCLQVKPQLVAAVSCQLMQQVVTQPVVASRVVESNFELRP